MGRLHDSRRGAYLKVITKTLGERKSEVDAVERFTNLERTHNALIAKAERLRNAVFAHTDFRRPEHIAFGFRGLTYEDLETYWRDLASAVKFLEMRVFGSTEDYGPKFDVNDLESDITRAKFQTFDELLRSDARTQSTPLLGHSFSF